MNQLMRPIQGSIYTYEEMTRLVLGDSPCLRFKHDDKQAVIQDACASEAEMLSIPGFAQSLWKYVRTTHEAIPVFDYVGEEPITHWVIMEENLNSLSEEDSIWATFILFPQLQYRG